ncbi:MAG: hypothetical protein NVSMB23_08600 [Myxococcales bacterium]
MRAVETRRQFVKKTLAGTALLAAASAVPLALRKTRLSNPGPRSALRFFTPAEYAIFAAVADRVLATAPADPAHPEFPGGAPANLPEVAAQVRAYGAAPAPAAVDVAGKADAFLAPLDAGSAKELKQLLALFDNALFSLLTLGPPTPFTAQDPAQQDRHLAAWAHSRLAVRRTGYQALKRLACAMYFASPETYASVGYPGPPRDLVRAVNQARSEGARGKEAPR